MTDETKLYVESLPFDVDDAQLRELFSKYGQITDAYIVLEREDSSQSRGFGFVTFTERASAQAAIDGLNETPLGQRHIIVQFTGEPASGRPPATRGGRGRGGSYSGRGGYRGGYEGGYGGGYGGGESSDRGGYGGGSYPGRGGYGGYGEDRY